MTAVTFNLYVTRRSNHSGPGCSVFNGNDEVCSAVAYWIWEALSDFRTVSTVGPIARTELEWNKRKPCLSFGTADVYPPRPRLAPRPIYPKRVLGSCGGDTYQRRGA